MRLALFDFDGTVTRRDSFLDFLIYAAGVPRFATGIIVNIPSLLMYMAGVIPNWKAKENLIGHFFRGLPIDDFRTLGMSYARERIPVIARPEAMRRIEWHRSEGHRIAIVTASAGDWINGWCRELGLDLIATRLEVSGSRLTGKIDGKNCHGAEKVRRIREAYRMEDYEYFYAYGDSRGDLEMMALADEKYYKWLPVR